MVAGAERRTSLSPSAASPAVIRSISAHLEPGVDLTATGSWTLDTCGSGFVPEHPAHRYVFTLYQSSRVLIDLKSDNGDPVLSLISPSDGVIGANDDGGEYRNSRIERYLQTGCLSHRGHHLP